MFRGTPGAAAAGAASLRSSVAASIELQMPAASTITADPTKKCPPFPTHAHAPVVVEKNPAHTKAIRQKLPLIQSTCGGIPRV